jgi:lipopolysaccharide export system protein LptA
MLFINSVCLAADDAQQPIKISADSMQLDINNGNSEYRGNVSIQKGSILLQGELVIISRSDNTVDNIKITGTPASYQQQTEQGDTRAQSEIMWFDVNTNILTMKINARLNQGRQLIESQTIQFDTDNQTVLAGATSAGSTGNKNKQRVNITLTPDNDGDR